MLSHCKYATLFTKKWWLDQLNYQQLTTWVKSPSSVSCQYRNNDKESKTSFQNFWREFWNAHICHMTDENYCFTAHCLVLFYCFTAHYNEVSIKLYIMTNFQTQCSVFSLKLIWTPVHLHTVKNKRSRSPNRKLGFQKWCETISSMTWGPDNNCTKLCV